MDYSFKTACVEVEKNFSKQRPTKAIVKAVAENLKKGEKKDAKF